MDDNKKDNLEITLEDLNELKKKLRSLKENIDKKNNPARQVPYIRQVHQVIAAVQFSFQILAKAHSFKICLLNCPYEKSIPLHNITKLHSLICRNQRFFNTAFTVQWLIRKNRPETDFGFLISI